MKYRYYTSHNEAVLIHAWINILDHGHIVACALYYISCSVSPRCHRPSLYNKARETHHLNCLQSLTASGIYLDWMKRLRPNFLTSAQKTSPRNFLQAPSWRDSPWKSVVPPCRDMTQAQAQIEAGRKKKNSEISTIQGRFSPPPFGEVPRKTDRTSYPQKLNRSEHEL